MALTIGGNWNDIARDCVKTVPTSQGPQQVATLNCLPAVFHNLVEVLLVFAAAVLLIMIIWVGFKLINSSGDPKNIATAKSTLTYAIVGFIFVMAAYLIITIISAFTGAHCITSFGFTNCH